VDFEYQRLEENAGDAEESEQQGKGDFENPRFEVNAGDAKESEKQGKVDFEYQRFEVNAGDAEKNEQGKGDFENPHLEVEAQTCERDLREGTDRFASFAFGSSIDAACPACMSTASFSEVVLMVFGRAANFCQGRKDLLQVMRHAVFQRSVIQSISETVAMIDANLGGRNMSCEAWAATRQEMATVVYNTVLEVRSSLA